MRHALIFCFAALALPWAGSAPVPAQEVVEGVYEVGNPDAPLNFVQRQAVAEIREKDRSRYMSTARDAGILLPQRSSSPSRAVKPIAEWTLGDLWRFRRLYDLYAEQIEGLEKWSVHELSTLVRHLTLDGGGEGDGGGED